MLEDMTNHDYWENKIFQNDQDCQHEELITSTPIIDTPIENIKDCHLKESTKREEHLELFHNNDSLSEVGIQKLVIEEESQEKFSSAQPIVTTLIIQDHIYEDPMWPIPPPPTLASFIYVP